MEYTIPQSVVESMTGYNADRLRLYFLSPNVFAADVPVIGGGFVEVKRPWHGDSEMRGKLIEPEA